MLRSWQGRQARARGNENRRDSMDTNRESGFERRGMMPSSCQSSSSKWLGSYLSGEESIHLPSCGSTVGLHNDRFKSRATTRTRVAGAGMRRGSKKFCRHPIQSVSMARGWTTNVFKHVRDWHRCSFCLFIYLIFLVGPWPSPWVIRAPCTS